MFYTRPKIEPLGWDLIALPVWDGGEHFNASTTDGRPVRFDFQDGSVRAWIGSQGANEATEKVVDYNIAPVGCYFIHPIQLCDVLGLTVKGKAQNPAELSTSEIAFDFSGNTTYWSYTHLRVLQSDMQEFFNELANVYPDCIFIQRAELGSNSKYRQIPFVCDTDGTVKMGVSPNRALLEKALAGDGADSKALNAAFDYSVGFAIGSDPSKVFTRNMLDENGAKELGLKYLIPDFRFASMSATYATSDEKAQSFAKTLLSLVEKKFYSGAEYIDLQTNKIITRKDDGWRYSGQLKDWCLERPDRFLHVGVETPRGRDIAREINSGDVLGKEDEVMFYGMRPLK